MKKFLLIIGLILFILPTSVNAETVKVESLECFSTLAPSQTYSVLTLEKIDFKDGTIIEAGTVITGDVFKIEAPKRGKRDAYFEIIPTQLEYNGIVYKVKDIPMAAKVVDYEPLDAKQLAISAAKTTAGILVKGASQGISFAQGILQDTEGNRLKSGLVKVYKDSPLSYIEEGDELEINAGDILTLSIKKIH